MITLPHFHVEEIVMYQIFSYFANNAIEVNLIVAFVKYIIEEWEPIAVIKQKLTNHPLLQVNV
jgi:hypothetical protein